MRFIFSLIIFLGILISLANANVTDPRLGFIVKTEAICRSNRGLSITVGRNLQGLLLLEANKYQRLSTYALTRTANGYHSINDPGPAHAVKVIRHPDKTIQVSFHDGWGGHFGFASNECLFTNQ